MGVKDKIVHKFYYDFAGEKPDYNIYMQRVTRFGYSKEKAILLVDNRKKVKTPISENGRVCTTCKIFKTWDFFHNSKRLSTGKCAQCIDCRNAKKQEYRKTIQGQIKEKNYKILKKSDIEYKRKEYEAHKIWVEKHKEQRSQSNLRYRTANASKIKARKKELIQLYFSPGKKVYFGSIIGKIIDVKKGYGCLVDLENSMRMWIARSRLKPYKTISYEKKVKSLFS